MSETIRPMRAADVAPIVQLSLAAWEPVFRSFERVLGTEIYTRIYPDWKTSQAAAVEAVCTGGTYEVWVAEAAGAVVGFVACEFREASKTGEVEMLAVHPASQNRGIGTRLNGFALDRMRERGMRLAEVGTGGDPGHAPARRTYEKAGYTALPIVRYYQALSGDPGESGSAAEPGGSRESGAGGVRGDSQQSAVSNL
jgi:ribosomal protein S18 acetylase RimI-like enzyme